MLTATITADPEDIRRGATLRALRESRGLLVGEMATALGKSHGYISNIEAGRKRLTPKLALQVARLLDVRVAALIRPDEFGDAA